MRTSGSASRGLVARRQTRHALVRYMTGLFVQGLLTPVGPGRTMDELPNNVAMGGGARTMSS
jgi:hypothetical protein